MRPITVSVGPLAAASANNICLSQGPSSGAATINGSTASGGVSTLDKARFIIITSAGDDSLLTWTVTGTDGAGNLISDQFAGKNGAAQSNMNFLTVTGVSSSVSTASTFTVGTNGLAASSPVRFDDYAFGPTFAQVNVSGTVNWTLQGTNDDPNDIANPVSRYLMVWSSTAPTMLIAQTTTAQVQMDCPPKFVRLLLNSGSGSATATFVQYASAP